jgi:polysaccharide pyruvyl transferase WcaK-like protein
MITKLVRQSINPNRIFVFSFDVAKDDEIIRAIGSKEVQFLPSPARTASGDKSEIFVEMVSFLAWALLYRLTGRSIIRGKLRPIGKALLDSDLLIVEGGDSLADIYGIYSLVKHYFNIVLGIVLGKKMVLMGNTIGPFRSNLALHVLFALLHRMEEIVVRDQRSYDLLIDNNFSPTIVHMIPDVAFDLPVEKASESFLDAGRNNVGIVTSALISKLNGKDNYTSFLAEICDYMIEKHNAKIIFVPHVIYDGNNDREIAAEVLRKMARREAVLIPPEANPLRVKHVISCLSLIISPRMHPVIHALSSGVPVIAVDYNKKTREVMKLADKEEWVLDLENLGSLRILVDRFFAMRKEVESFYTIKRIHVTDDYVNFLKNVSRTIHAES